MGHTVVLNALEYLQPICVPNTRSPQSTKKRKKENQKLIGKEKLPWIRGLTERLSENSSKLPRENKKIILEKEKLHHWLAEVNQH